MLLFPRATVPEDIPLPEVDARALARVEEEDHRRAERARHEPLSAQVRELGSAIREFNMREARDDDASMMSDARNALGPALLRALGEGVEPVLRLRAVQMEAFLAEVRRFEATGQKSPELDALGGTFVRRMKDVGWCQGRVVLLSDTERRVAFKLAWNGVASVTGRPEFVPSLDEMRALYTLYLRHPHASETARARIDSARRVAKDKAACEALEAGENLAADTWRLDKITKLGALDPSYPTAYARGVVQFRLGHYEESVSAFQAWIEAHPGGPWTLRARNHLKAALAASRI